MRKILFLACLFFYALPAVATPQASDNLIYEGKRYYLYHLPLYDLYETDTIKYLDLVKPASFCGTGCYRKYVGTWEVIGNELYLTALSSCCDLEAKNQIDLKALFGEKCIAGKVKADWVTSRLTASPTDATPIYYMHAGWGATYDKETSFHFEKGRLINTMPYTNSRTHNAYTDNVKKLHKFFYAHIDWQKIPAFEGTIKVFVHFSANEVGKIDSAKVLKGHSKPFDEEAVHLVKLIPEWEVFYKRGKHQRMYWTIPILFREEDRY